MWIRKADNDSIFYIASNMRALDDEEIFSTRWDDDKQRITDEIMISPGLTWVLGKNDHPVMAFGAMPLHPGVWSVWMFATDDFNQIALAATRYVKKMITRVVKDTEAHRAECNSSSSHVVAHRWLEHLGFHEESVLKQFGKNGEDFYKYVWRKK